MKVIESLLITLLSILFIAACATIVSKSQYPVIISSQPDGADINVINSVGKTVFTGKTPTTITLKAGAGFFKGEDYTVEFKKEGYTPHTAQIRRGVDGWYIFGNLFIGGLIGWLIVDPATGAMWTLDNLHINMTPQTSSLQKEELRVVTIDNIPEHLRSKLIRIYY